MVKANFPARLVGKVTSASDAHVATGLAGSGAEKLQGRGDFLLIAGGDRLRVQIAYLAPGDTHEFRNLVLPHPVAANPPSLLGRFAGTA